MNPEPRLLLLSSSRTAGAGFLDHAREFVARFLDHGIRRAVFVPYAAVRIGYDEYAERVRTWFATLNCELASLHQVRDPAQAIAEAEAVVVGGGNTFHLLDSLYKHALLEPLRRRAVAGMPYIGWSAGANLACPTIRTTNDMPVVWPSSCEALGLVPFQINPHYTQVHPEGHQGETRAERLDEFATLNPDITVIGLPEGCALQIEAGTIQLLGTQSASILQGRLQWNAAPGRLLLEHAGDGGQGTR